MSNSESMIVRIEADPSGLTQALTKADVVVSGFSNRVNSHMGKVSDAVSGLQSVLARAGIAVGLTEIAQSSFKAVQSLAELNDQAKQLGINVETFQSLGLVAMQNGSDIGKMGDSLEQFNKRLGEAQAGQGSLLDILNQYGIAVRDSTGKNRSNIDVLYDLSDIMATLTDKTEQTRLATEAFGRSGGEMIETFSKGSVEIRSLGQSAQESGLIIQQDLIDRAQEFDDKWKLAAYKFGVYFKVAAGDVLLELDKIGASLADQISGASAPYSKIKFPEGGTDLERASKGSLKGVGAWNKTVQNYMDNLGSVSSPFETSKKQSDQTRAAADKKVAAYKDVIDGLKFEMEQLDRTNVQQEIYNNLKRAGVSASSAEGKQIAVLTEKYRSHADEMQNTAEAARQMAATITDSMNSAILGTEGLGKSLQKIGLQFANSALTKYVTGPAANFFSDALGSLFKFEKGGIMTSSGSVPLRAYAGGGVANSPQLSLFGEGRLPEAYVPLPDGRTIPVTMRGGSGGGSVQVVQHLNISTGVEQTTRAEILKAMPQIRQAAVAAVNDAAKRGKVSF